MRLQEVSTLTEMGKPAQACPKCGGSPISKTHYYYKGAWSCRPGAVAAYQAQQAGGGTPATTPSPVAASPASPASPVAPAAPKPAAPVQPPVQAVAPPKAAPAPQQPLPGDPASNPAATASHEQQARTWLKIHHVEEDAITYNNSAFDINEDVTLVDIRLNAKRLPVKFGTITGDFAVLSGTIESFHNFPSTVTGDLQVKTHPIKSFEGFPSQIGGDVILKELALTDFVTSTPVEIQGNFTVTENNSKSLSLLGIHKNIKRVSGGRIEINTKITQGGLGLLAIKGVKEIKLHIDQSKIADILNAQLKSGDRDINQAQEELIDGGFKEFAKM